MSEELEPKPEPTPEPVPDSIPKYRFDEVNNSYKSAKAEVEALQKQIEELSGKAGATEELRKEIETIKAESEKRIAESETKRAEFEKTSALEVALIAAGCVDVKAAKAHIALDDIELKDGKVKGFDIDEFKESKTYLFNAPKTASIGAPAENAKDDSSALRRAAGLKD